MSRTKTDDYRNAVRKTKLPAKYDKSFYQVLDTINRMIDNKAENSPRGTNTKPRKP